MTGGRLDEKIRERRAERTLPFKRHAVREGCPASASGSATDGGGGTGRAATHAPAGRKPEWSYGLGGGDATVQCQVGSRRVRQVVLRGMPLKHRRPREEEQPVVAGFPREPDRCCCFVRLHVTCNLPSHDREESGPGLLQRKDGGGFADPITRPARRRSGEVRPRSRMGPPRCGQLRRGRVSCSARAAGGR